MSCWVVMGDGGWWMVGGVWWVVGGGYKHKHRYKQKCKHINIYLIQYIDNSIILLNNYGWGWAGDGGQEWGPIGPRSRPTPHP